MNDLERFAKEIRKHVEGLGLVCFPEAIDDDASSLVVRWPGEDWKEFLAFAPKLGVGVVYVGSRIFEDLGDEDYEVDADPEGLSEHDGEIDTVLVTYVAGGVLHSWRRVAQWRVEAMVREVTAFGDRDAKAEKLKERAEQEGWAHALAHDRRFYGAARTDQRAACTTVLAELAGVPETDSLLNDVPRAVIREANELLPEVREGLQDDGLSHKADLAAELVDTHPDWWTMRVALREKYARTLVKERYGMALPIVAEEVARHKLTSDDPTLL